MIGSHRKAGAGSYRDKVTELIAQGATLGDVEAGLHARAELTKDQKAALWLFAFSLRDRAEQENDAEAHLTTVEVATQTTDCARPREFDANGFPVPQGNRSFLERVARLRSPQKTPCVAAGTRLG